MNVSNNTGRIVPAIAVPEGAGVTVHRTIGTPSLRNFDPFMLLDHMGSDNPDDYIAGFPEHPHRGFITFTYMVDGHFEHKDSMGNTGHLGPGSAQWMKAASGVIHSEMPQMEDGLLRGFQLWVNLPGAHKMDEPEYQEFQSDAFPVVEKGDVEVKVLIGEYGGQHAPIVDDITGVQYYDVKVKPGQRFSHALPAENNSFIYVFEGDGEVNGSAVDQHTLVTFGGDNSTIDLVAGESGTRLIVVSGRPIGEPVVQYGPFVMNTREEIEQAVHDFQSNDFVRHKAWMRREKAPVKQGDHHVS